MKRLSCSKKRRVEHATFLKWKHDLDREHQTLSWLKCDCAVESGKKVVFKLGLYAFEEKIKAGRILVPSGSRELT